MRHHRLFIGLLIIALAIGTLLIFMESRKEKSNVPLKNEGSQFEDYALILREFDSYRVGEAVCVQGIIKNISGTTLGYVRVIPVFYDKNDEVLEFGSGFVSSARNVIKDSEEANFKRCINDADKNVSLENMKIYFEGKIGGDYRDVNLEWKEK